MVGAGIGVGEKIERYQEAVEKESVLKQQIADCPSGVNTPESRKLQSSYRQAKEHVKSLENI